MTSRTSHLQNVRDKMIDGYQRSRKQHRGQAAAFGAAFKATTHLLRAEVDAGNRRRRAEARKLPSRPSAPDLFAMDFA